MEVRDPTLLDHLNEHETTSQRWGFTIPDDQTLYLSFDGVFLELNITRVPIWEAFQKILLEAAVLSQGVCLPKALSPDLP